MFRFTIRELLLLTVIAALSVGWWLEHRTLSRVSSELKLSNEQLAAMRAEAAANNPLTLFDWETDRLRQQLAKLPPLAVYLAPKRNPRQLPQDDQARSFIKARQQLENDAEAAGYEIRRGNDGRLTLEPKWQGSRPVSGSPPRDDL